MVRAVYNPGEDGDNSLPIENVDAELRTQTRELYTNFLHEEIQSHGFHVPTTLT